MEDKICTFNLRKWLSQTVGVDKAVAYSVSSRFWQIIVGLVNVALIAKFVTSSEQGYLYTFQSLLGFQILFDLSLSAVLIQFAGHEMAKLKWDLHGRVQGDSIAKSRLASLIKISFKWYTVAAVLMLLLLTTGGYLFFEAKQTAAAVVSWQLPWLLLCVAASILIIFTPVLGIIEGCGKVTEIAKFRLYQGTVCALIYWGALVTDLRLMALPILFFSQVVTLLIYLFVFKRSFLGDLKNTHTDAAINFRVEIWPFQWRFLICSIASLLATFLTIPIVFAAQGPVVAGQLGMTLQITGALLSVSMVWISTKVPLFCNLVALSHYEELDRVFRRVGKQSFLVMLFFSVGLIFMVAALNWALPSFAIRLVDPLTAAFLILAVLVAFPNVAGSSYLRAHKREVTAGANIVTAVVTLCLVYLVVPEKFISALTRSPQTPGAADLRSS